MDCLGYSINFFKFVRNLSLLFWWGGVGKVDVCFFTFYYSSITYLLLLTSETWLNLQNFSKIINIYEKFENYDVGCFGCYLAMC